MEQVIKALSEIEDRAVRMLLHAENTKKELAAEAEKRIDEYNRKTEEETAAAISKLKERLDDDLAALLLAQQEEADKHIAMLEDIYNNRHTEIAEDIFEELTR